MRALWQRGDLVHIPQAVQLVDCDISTPDDPQLSIPIAVHHTEKPEVAVILATSDHGYLRVWWDGRPWSVKDDRVYSLGAT